MLARLTPRPMRLALLLLLWCVSAAVWAQGSPSDSARAARLAEHVVALDGSADGEGAFVRAVGAARVVALGEPTHGDGAAFALRNTLTQALHERGGFGLLALEATGVAELPETFASPTEARAAVDSVGGRLWVSSEEARPGLLLAASTVGTVRPLRPVGIDVQHRAAGARVLLDTVAAALGRMGALDGRWPAVRRTLAAAFEDPFAPVDSTTQAATVGAVADYGWALGEREARAASFLRTALANALVPWTRTFEPRDRQMGENAVALVQRTGSKAVMWSASSHAVRQIAAVDRMRPDEEWNYDGMVTMGDRIDRALGDGYYVAAFTACGGTYGAAALDLVETSIEPPAPGSLEALVCAVPFETAAFVDLRALAATEEGVWLSGPLMARPLGYSAMLASWPLVLDGLIVVREMTPSTPRVEED